MERKRKSARTSAAPKLNDLDAQQRRLALIKQKQCDAIALHIVTKLIDCAVDEDAFLQSLKYMNQSHYDDIVEERVISKMCGYPICANILPDMPAKKYHISTKLNKIYDISERKNYCTNFCYKAGIYIKEQMLTSPLWFRDKEEIPNFQLLPRTESGIPGKEIDQGLVKVELNEDENFTSVSDLTEELINDIPEDLYHKLDIKCEKSENIPNEVKEESKININDKINAENENQEKEKESYYFSIIHEPCLADILKENAEYFDNISGNKQEDKNKSCNTTNINKKLNKETLQTKTEPNKTKCLNKSETISRTKEYLSNTSATELNEEIKNISNDKETIINNKSNEQKSSEIQNIKIGFDRTVINNKSNVKSILSKEKKINKKSEKKRVSFNSENNVKEIEKIDYNAHQKFEKKNEVVKLKNMNLIGEVQEKSNVCKYQIVQLNNSDLNNGFTENIETSNTLEIENTKSAETNNKKARLTRLKNSAAYKKISRVSKARSIQNKNQIDIKLKLFKCTEEWCTLDTFIFLYGEDYIKKKISEKTYEQYLNKKQAIELDDQKQKKYDEMCKTLNLSDLADRQYDESVTGKKLRPLPQFKELREQAEDMDLRVKAFYSGCHEVDEDDCNSDTESTKDQDEEALIALGSPAVLPLVDSKDIAAIRRKIFLLSLNRRISVVCEILKQSPNSLLSDIKQLINTFEFTAKNIVFKTGEWQLVIILLVKILAIRDQKLHQVLHSYEASLYMNSLREQFNITERNIDEFLFTNIDIEKILEQCIKKKVLNK